MDHTRAFGGKPLILGFEEFNRVLTELSESHDGETLDEWSERHQIEPGYLSRLLSAIYRAHPDPTKNLYHAFALGWEMGVEYHQAIKESRDM